MCVRVVRVFVRGGGGRAHLSTKFASHPPTLHVQGPTAADPPVTHSNPPVTHSKTSPY